MAFFTYPNTGVLKVGFMRCNFFKIWTSHPSGSVLRSKCTFYSYGFMRLQQIFRTACRFAVSEYRCFVWCKLCFWYKERCLSGVLPW